MQFKVAFTSDAARIATGLAQGKIDDGDLILVTDASSPYGRLVIIDDTGQQVQIAGSIRKFANLQLANAWLADQKAPPVGEMVSIFVNNKYMIYSINDSDSGFTFETPIAGGAGSEWINI